jgi:broad specificity phosphatase PhoE
MTRVLLVRHGQSEWNAQGRWQGQADPALSELGRTQARHAARSVGAVDAIISSDLQRATETAAILSAELGIGPVLTDPDLRERHAGEWQGLTRAEIHQGWPGYLDAPDGAAGWEPRRPPGWEPDGSVLARATTALIRIHETIAGGDALVVTHAGLIYAVEGSLGHPFERIGNLAGRWVEVGPRGPGALGERVVLVDPSELTVPDQL